MDLSWNGDQHHLSSDFISMLASSFLGLPLVEKAQGNLCKAVELKLQEQGEFGTRGPFPMVMGTEFLGSCPCPTQGTGTHPGCILRPCTKHP